MTSDTPFESAASAGPVLAPVTGRRACILIMGMHRSGTSMLAGILDRLGCASAANLMPANFANERGYYESAAISRFNEDVMEAADRAWDDLRPIENDWFDTPQAAEFQDKASVLLDAEFESSALFALKDPRLCRLMRLWKPVFAAKGIDLRVIQISRDPAAVAASLNRRDGIDTEYGLLLWLRHVIEAEFSCRDLPRVFITYDQVLQDWSGVLTRAADGLGLSWQAPPQSIQSEIDRFVSADLDHFHPDPVSMAAHGLIVGWAHEVSKLFKNGAHKRQWSDQADRLDKIRGRIDREVMPFARLFGVGNGAQRVLARALVPPGRPAGGTAGFRQDAATVRAWLQEAQEVRRQAALECDLARAETAEHQAALDLARRDIEVLRIWLRETERALEAARIDVVGASTADPGL